MNYPDDRTMTVLHFLCCALDVTFLDDYGDGEVCILVPDEEALSGDRWEPFPLDVQETLRNRKWIELIGDSEVEVTKDGLHWCKRWCAEKDKETRGKKARRAATSWRRTPGR